MDMEHHTHTSDCIGVNELAELTCCDMHRDHLRNARRHTVRVTFGTPRHGRVTQDIRVFTHADDDAIAIVLADDPSLADDDVTMEIVYRDDEHRLDAFAPGPGYIRDDIPDL